MTFTSLLLITWTLAQAAPPQALSGATVEGIVVDLGTGNPIADAVVELRQNRPIDRPLPRSTTLTTGPDGKFAFKDPLAGEYRLYATRSRGHIPTEYGQRTPTGTGTPFTVANNQRLTGVTLRMAPVSSISGRILDEAGDPVAFAGVDVLHPGYQNGKRRLIPGLAVRTDDRGEYRLFNLPPGQYYVAARPWDARSTRGNPASESTGMPNRFAARESAGNPMISKRVTESGEIVEETWMPIYYPGTPDVRAARMIDLGTGQNIPGIDISLTLSPVPARTVRGTVIDGATGLPAGGALIRLTPREQLTPSLIMPMGTADANGAFEIPGVLPASYSLFVSGAVTGYAVVDASGGDVNNLRIVGITGVDIPVRVILDSGAGLVPPPANLTGTITLTTPQGAPFNLPPQSNTSLRVTLTREPGTGSPTGAFVITAGWPGVPPNTVTPPVQSLESGGYMLRNVSLGEYRVSVAGLAAGSFVKSIRRGQSDVMRDGLPVLRAGTPTDDPLEIVIGANAGSLAGRVISDAGEPVANATVALVPGPQRRSQIDLYQAVSTDMNGSFRFQGIAPDEYKLFSWEDVPPGAWHDADFMKPFENRGVSVIVGQGTNAPQEIRVIP